MKIDPDFLLDDDEPSISSYKTKKIQTGQEGLR